MKYSIIDPRLNDFDFKPTREGDAGIDLRAAIKSPITVAKGMVQLINTGVKVAIPEHWVGLILPRSGLGVKKGLTLANTIGCIDSNYRGELVVPIITNRIPPFEIAPMDRIAQLVIVPHYEYSKLEQVDELDATLRGSEGFGSSGIQ